MTNIFKELKRKDNNNLHTEQGHPLEDLTWATGKAIGLQLTGTFKPTKACILGKAQKAQVSKIAVQCLIVNGGRLFINESSPFTADNDSKKHWLLVVEDSTNYAWSHFLKEKSELKDVIISLLRLKGNVWC